MVGLCIVCYGGVLYVMAVYCMLWPCTMVVYFVAVYRVLGGVLCFMAVMLWWCTVCYGGVLCVMAVYCMLWWCAVPCSVWYGGELCVTAVYCMLGSCTVW